MKVYCTAWKWWLSNNFRFVHAHFELNFRYNRVEVPVEIVPNEAISDACLEALEQLPDILGQVDIYIYIYGHRHP